MSIDHNAETPNPDVTPTLPGNTEQPTQKLRKDTGPKKTVSLRIGEILVKKGVLTEARLKIVLDKQKKLCASGKDVSLGKLIVDSGIVTQDQLQEYLHQQAGLKELGGYKIINKIGQGGMGTVYRALQISMNREVALKILPRKQSQNETFIKRFHREARTAARLNHPNVVTAIDVGEDKGLHFFAMEYVPGITLKGLMDKTNAPLNENYCAHVVKQVVIGLAHATKENIIHRDIKPDNILLTSAIRSGDNEKPQLGNMDDIVKIADLGLAKFNDENQTFITQAGSTLGTPHYISPEQAMGEEDIDFRADMYSLGATFYHMATNTPPFAGTTVGQIVTAHVNKPLENPISRNPELSDGCASIIMRMMQKKPSNRYSSNAQLIADLDKLLKGKRVKSKVVSGAADSLIEGTSDAKKKRVIVSRKHQSPVLLGVAAVVVIGIIVAIMKLLPGDDQGGNGGSQVSKTDPGTTPTTGSSDHTNSGTKSVTNDKTHIDVNPDLKTSDMLALYRKSESSYKAKYQEKKYDFGEKIGFWKAAKTTFSKINRPDTAQNKIDVIIKIDKQIKTITSNRKNLIDKTIDGLKIQLLDFSEKNMWAEGSELLNKWEDTFKPMITDTELLKQISKEKNLSRNFFFENLLKTIQSDFDLLWRDQNKSVIDKWVNTPLPLLIHPVKKGTTFNIQEAIKKRLSLYEQHKNNLKNTEKIRDMADFINENWHLSLEKSRDQINNLKTALKNINSDSPPSYVSSLRNWIHIQEESEKFISEFQKSMKKLENTKHKLENTKLKITIDKRYYYIRHVQKDSFELTLGSKGTPVTYNFNNIPPSLMRVLASKVSGNKYINDIKNLRLYLAAQQRFRDCSAPGIVSLETRAICHWFSMLFPKYLDRDLRIPCLLTNTKDYNWAVNFQKLDKIEKYFFNQNPGAASAALKQDPLGHGLIFNNHALSFWNTIKAESPWSVEGLSWPGQSNDNMYLSLQGSNRTLSVSLSHNDLNVSESNGLSPAIAVGLQVAKLPPIVQDRPLHWKISYDPQESKIFIFVHGVLVHSISNKTDLIIGDMTTTLGGDSWAHELFAIRGCRF